MQKSTIVIIAVLVLVVVIGVVVSQENEKNEIVIGVGMPLTGSLAKFGEWMQRGFVLAEQDINDLEIFSVPIRLVYEDTKCSPSETNTVLRKFKDVDKVTAFVGPFCGGSLVAAGQFTKDNSLLGITPNTNFGRLSEYFFSTQSFLAEEPKTMSKLAYKDLDLRRVAVFHHNNDFGVLHKEVFADVFTKLGGEITHVESLQNGQSNFRTELLKLKTSNPDALYIGYSAIAPILNQMKELQFDVPVLSQFGVETPELLRVAGDNAEGLVYTFRGTASGDESKKQRVFRERYESMYQESMGFMSAEAYDALMILSQALAACEDVSYNVDCLRDEVLKVDLDGVSGHIKIDPETYNVDKPIIIKTVRNGQFVPYK